MTGFSDRSFESRFGWMGDTSERVFEQVERGWTRYGLQRPNVNVAKLPLKIRYTPDYLQTKCLVEVQAMGKDGFLKIKQEKVIALCLWASEMPLDFFVWDSGTGMFGRASWDDLHVELCLSAVGGTFASDGKAHWRLGRDSIPVVSWVPYEAES